MAYKKQNDAINNYGDPWDGIRRTRNDYINEDARKVQNQVEYEVRYASLTRFNNKKARLEEVSTEVFEKKSMKEIVELFIVGLEK